MKSRAKLLTGMIAIMLSFIMLFIVVAMKNIEVKSNTVSASTRTMTLSNSAVESQSIFNDFDDVSLIKEGTITFFEGSKNINEDLLGEIDYISDGDFAEFENYTVRYYASYDEATDLVSLYATKENDDGELLIDVIYGLAFINEKGNPDAFLDIEGETVLLSEMQDLGLIENCGWFSKLIAAAVAAVVVTAIVATAMVVTGGAALGAVVGVCAAVGAGVGGTTSVVVGFVEGETSIGEIAANFAAGAGVGAVAGAVTGAAVYGIHSLVSASKATSALNRVILNKQNHILQAKHRWDLVGGNTWSKVSNIIKFVLVNGTVITNSVGNEIYSAEYGGQIIEVTTRVVNGILTIVDAWVKTH